MRTNLALTAASTIGALVLAVTVAHVALAQGSAALDTAAIEQATGLKGQLIAEENVFKS